MPAFTSTSWPRAMTRSTRPGSILRDRVDQADMRGDVNDAQLRRHQHHRHFRRAGQMRQQFGVAGIFVAGGMQRFLGQRRGADALRDARLHDLARPSRCSDRPPRRRPATSGRTADRPARSSDRRTARAFDAKSASLASAQRSRRRACAPTIRPALRRRSASPITSGLQIACASGMRQRLHDDLGADAGGIAHGDRNGRTGHVKLPLVRTARRRSLMRMRLSSSPKAPPWWRSERRVRRASGRATRPARSRRRDGCR